MKNYHVAIMFFFLEFTKLVNKPDCIKNTKPINNNTICAKLNASYLYEKVNKKVLSVSL